ERARARRPVRNDPRRRSRLSRDSAGALLRARAVRRAPERRGARHRAGRGATRAALRDHRPDCEAGVTTIRPEVQSLPRYKPAVKGKKQLVGPDGKRIARLNANEGPWPPF